MPQMNWVVLGFCITGWLMFFLNPVTITQIIPVVVREVRVIESEPTIEIRGELNQFENEREMRAWLKAHPPPDLGEGDCDDYAFWLIETARSEGYDIHLQIELWEHHARCSTVIGNVIYFIDPQRDKCILGGYID